MLDEGDLDDVKNRVWTKIIIGENNGDLSLIVNSINAATLSIIIIIMITYHDNDEDHHQLPI